MAISANSYGTTAGVGALTPLHTSGGAFGIATRPTLSQVESFIDQVSAIMNTVLAQYGFDVPVSQADAKLALDMFCNAECASIVEGVNGSGRFGPTTKNPNSRRYILITEDVQKFVEANAIGLQRLGAARDYSLTAGLDARTFDERGNDIHPIFQRNAFGNTFDNWDA